jgi:thioester reductase-like protein
MRWFPVIAFYMGITGWRVDFKLSLASFEPNIKSVRNLIDLSRDSLHSVHMLFTSTVGVVRCSSQSSSLDFILTTISSAYPATNVPESPDIDPHFAVGSGYSESKWVGERILELAGGSTTVVRIGQLCGGKRSGAWNEKEWVPTMVRLGQKLTCLPAEDQVCTFFLQMGPHSNVLDL